MSFIFILNVHLALQSSSDIWCNNKASGPMLVVVASGLTDHVESVGASKRLGGSTREVQWLLDSILTDI